jgi:hypothetical protein
VIAVDNSGPVVTISMSPSQPAPYLMDNFNPSTVSVVYLSGPAIAKVTFVKQMAKTASLIGAYPVFTAHTCSL